MKTIEQHAGPARVRTGYLLCGLLAATPAVQVATHYALCDRSGAPACGNIGQVGSPLPPAPITVALPAPPAPAPTITTNHTAPLLTISITQSLVAPPAREHEVVRVARPVVDLAAKPVCANVMNKGGSRRVCRDAEGTVVGETRLDQ